jgi:hypothetical protein
MIEPRDSEIRLNKTSRKKSPTSRTAVAGLIGHAGAIAGKRVRAPGAIQNARAAASLATGPDGAASPKAMAKRVGRLDVPVRMASRGHHPPAGEGSDSHGRQENSQR